jgi:2-methylcitrate dehydratase PrpD
LKDNATATDAVVRFIAQATFEELPPEAIAIAKHCIIDGIGVMLAGSTQAAGRIVRELAADLGTRTEATAFGPEPMRTGVAQAALVNGTSGHALDWDDTQLATSADRIFGLLTHPTIPPLIATLAIGERDGITGRRFLEAFLTGFEVECKIAEAISPSHYKKGFHSSGTIGTFGAAAATAKLLGLDEEQLGHMLAIAASSASGIRVNFGSMTKPLHVGRAAENGIVAAELASRGFTRWTRRGAFFSRSAMAKASMPIASSASSVSRIRSSGPVSRSNRILAACWAIRRWTRCAGWSSTMTSMPPTSSRSASAPARIS